MSCDQQIPMALNRKKKSQIRVCKSYLDYVELTKSTLKYHSEWSLKNLQKRQGRFSFFNVVREKSQQHAVNKKIALVTKLFGFVMKL